MNVDSNDVEVMINQIEKMASTWKNSERLGAQEAIREIRVKFREVVDKSLYKNPRHAEEKHS